MNQAFTGRIADWSARNRWVVLAGAVVVLAISALLQNTLGVKTSDVSGAGDAREGQKLLEDRFTAFEPPAEFILFSNPSLVVEEPNFKATVEPLVAELGGLEGVASVVSFYDAPLPFMVSQDRHVLMARLTFKPAKVEQLREWVDPVIEAVKDANVQAAEAGFEIEVFGGTSSFKSFETQLEKDFSKILVIALIGGLIILLLAFGSVVAAIVPLAMAAIFATAGAAVLVSRVQVLNLYYYEMVLLMGLAVGVDYTLFIVNRFREERAAGRSKLDAIRVASNTTGRAVFYAGVVVVVSLAGLTLTGDTLFIGLGLGAVIVVLFTMIASVTLLPALLALLGDGVNWLRIPGLGRPSQGGGLWGAISDAVLARPRYLCWGIPGGPAGPGRAPVFPPCRNHPLQ